jgi:hypothetical protein
VKDETIAPALKPKRVRQYKEDVVTQNAILKIDLHAAQVKARTLAEENIRLRGRDGKLTTAASVLALLVIVLAFALIGGVK